MGTGGDGMTETPIGTLILDSEARSKKKATKAHTSTSSCGCQVSVSWFSEDSRSMKIERCSDHALDPKRKR